MAEEAFRLVLFVVAIVLSMALGFALGIRRERRMEGDRWRELERLGQKGQKDEPARNR